MATLANALVTLYQLNCSIDSWSFKYRHGVAAFDFATVSGCDQSVVGPTHARDETLNLPMTDVADLARVAAGTPIDNSDHSSLSAGDHFDGSGCYKLAC